MVFGGIFVIPTGQQASLTVSYLLPSTVISLGPGGELIYSLRLVKQAGTDAISIVVNVIPPSEHECASECVWETLADGSLRWSGSLKSDTDLSLTLMPVAR